MSDDDSLFASVSVIAARIVELNKLGTDQYRPIVDDLIRSRCRDKQQIERTLDGLLDLCGYAPAVELFRRLCTTITSSIPRPPRTTSTVTARCGTAKMRKTHMHRAVQQSKPGRNAIKQAVVPADSFAECYLRQP